MGKEAAREVLKNFDIDAILLTSPANMRYIAGFTGEGYVYISREQALVVTDSRYTIAATAECPDFEVITWKSGTYYKILGDALRRDQAEKIGVEDLHMTVKDYMKLRAALEKQALANVEVKYLGELVTRYRQIKTEDEIRKIREAEAIGDRAFAKLCRKLKAGMTEKKVAALLEYYMKEEGAEGFSFDTIAASGLHSAMPHAVPTDKVLEPGDFLTMDFGCLHEGYCSDMTRTVVIGKADEEQKKVYETVLFAQQTALSKLHAGMTGKEIDALARDVITDAGYGEYFGHSLGHSVGLEIHEKPCFSPGENTVIQPGMVISVEPGIYIENFGGVRIEDLVVVTEDGCENLSSSPKELMEIE